MQTFLLIAPNILMMLVTVITCCLCNEWLSVFKDYYLNKLESDFKERHGYELY